MGRGGLEPPTSRLSGVRSNHLSYRPQTGYRIVKSVTLSRLGIRFEEIRGRLDRFAHLEYEHLLSKSLELLLNILRKEVIQPQVPLRLPCYDFTPVTDLTVACCLQKVSTQSSGKTNSHGVTGGVYKARERIHRVMLLRDY